MLFDLEDYVNWGIIGPNSKHPKLINWSEAYNASRATRDAYLKAVNEHFLAAQAMSTPVEFQALKVKHVAYLDAMVDFFPKYKTFWNTMISLPLVGVEGFTEGTKFDVSDVGKYDQNPNYNEYPASNPTNSWWMDNYKTVAVIDPNGPYTYTTSITEETIPSYKNSFIDFMATVKDILVTGEGNPEIITDWVEPEVPAYALYPEITGYVRGTNSLSIKDAIVRIIDADGVAHEVITDDKGYYKFSNEYIYNNFALTAAGATNSFIDGSFNMFLLDHKNGSTASLYNKTSKFENSFFGAENNRSMTWPVYVKMGRNNRRNFKIEFISDYSNFPSFSGYVKDAAGNPIKDAFVYIKEPNSGYGIGQYRKPNGDDAINYKYNDFGVDRTILTDENGFYEYTSQMVGEWFNKHGFVEYGMPTTILTEPTRTYESMNRWFMSNEFVVYLMPYKQDANSTSMNWGDGTPIYDNNDYAASRFEYAFSNVAQQFYWRDIEMGQSNVFNVDVVPAVGDEVMADKIKMTCTPGSQVLGGYFESTSGYCKFVFSNGVSEVKSNSWFAFYHHNYSYDTTMFSEEFYVYSCDSNGKALGYITDFRITDTEFSNLSNIDLEETEQLAHLQIWGLHASNIDLSSLNKLYRLQLCSSYYLETISGLESAKYLTQVSIFDNQRLTSLPFVNKDWIYSYEFTNLPMVSSLDLSTNGKKICIISNIQISIDGLETLESINLGFVGHTGDYGFYTQLYGCKQLLVDDVDSLLQQFVDSGKRVDLYTDKARSSDSDAAYDTLISRNSNLSFGSEYFESNEVKKSVVMYVDPSFGPDSNNSQKTISLNGNVTTTTGYFRLNAWYDNGYPLNQNIYQGQFNREINVEFDDTFESRSIEIYSTDEYGRPSGSITGIDFNNYNNEDFKNIVDIDLTQATELTSLIIKKSGLTSLDLTSNVMLDNLSIIESGKIETIYVGGLVSLNLLNLETMGSITTIDGVETLTGLDYIDISDCPELDFVSLSTLTSLREIKFYNVFKYDSTHVDTMLSELKLISDDRVSTLNTLLANKQSERDVKFTELSVFDAQEPTISTLSTELDTLYTELNQLISDGADQSLIDSKQAEVNTKSAELSAKEVDRKLISNQVDTLDSEISDLNSQISNLFSGYVFGTGYMARTSASDADYNSLLTYGWQLYIGTEFVAPYTLPVKGYITLGGNGQIYLNFRYLETSTGYYTFKDSTGNIYSNGGNSANFYAQTGVLEFWSTDQFGRAGGDFTELGFDNEYVTSVDFDNLTSLTSLSFKYTQITTIDVSNLTNLEWFECEFNSKITSITGLNLLDKLISLRLTECTRLTSVDTSGLESLTRLYLDGNSSLTDIDISVIGSTFSSLTSLTIYNQSFETPKHLDIHANINEINYNYFRTFTSADLDTLLSELDANGQSNGSLSTGYVARTEASDVAYSSLQSKGWNLNLGSYFIGPNEEPAIAYINFEGTSVNESISFIVNTETNYFVLKYPNGSTATRNGGWIYYDFNSDIPASERVFEIYGADQFGRPTDSINYLGQLYKCSSVDVSALKHLTAIAIDNNHMITSLDLDGLTNLRSIFANNCPLLETISIVGCTASKDEIYLNSCPQFDIDSFIIQLDQTGSIPTGNIAYVYADQDWGNGFTPARTSLSNNAAESLQSKGWDLRVAEPAGDSIQIITHGTAPRESWYDPNDYGFGIQFMSSTGYAKIIFEAGSEFESEYPNGLVSGNGQKWSDYDSAANGGFSSLFSASTLTSQKMTIFSCTGDGTPSGEIRYLNITGMARVFGSLSQLTKLKGLGLGMRWLKAQKTSVSLTGMKLEYLDINHNGWSSIEGDNTYISSIDATPILPTLKAFHYTGTYNSAYPGTSVTGINFVNLERMQIHSYNFGNTTLSGFTRINYLYLDSCSGLSIDFEDIITKYEQLQYFRISGTSDSSVNIINLDAIPLPQNIFMNYCNLVGNTDLVNTQDYANWLVYNTNVTSISGKINQLDVDYCNQLTSLTFSNGTGSGYGHINIQHCDLLQNCSFVTNQYFNNLTMRYCSILTSISVTSPYIQNVTLQNMPLLNSLDFSLNHYSYLNNLRVDYCNNITQIPQGLIDNVRYLFSNYTPVSFDLSNNSQLRYLYIDQISAVSGLSNKEYLEDVSISNMNITSLDFSNSFTYLGHQGIYKSATLQLQNISGLTSFNINNTKLKTLLLYGSNTIQNISNSATVDSILNALATGSKRYGRFYFQGFNTLRTSASGAAILNLTSNSWMLQS